MFQYMFWNGEKYIKNYGKDMSMLNSDIFN